MISLLDKVNGSFGTLFKDLYIQFERGYRLAGECVTICHLKNAQQLQLTGNADLSVRLLTKLLSFSLHASDQA